MPAASEPAASRAGERVRTWHPSVPHVEEVLHATFRAHAYPAHTHDAWTLLLIDAGAVRYDLDRAERIAAPSTLSILPPHIPHDGRSARPDTGFRKRVLYLDAAWLPSRLRTAAADRPLASPASAHAARAAHAALAHPGEQFAAESAIAVLRDRLVVDLERAVAVPRPHDDPLAARLRALLDDRLTETFTLAEAGSILQAHPGHLVRAFSRAYGIAPHRYVTGRRVDLARRLLAHGMRPAEAAASAGFHDQAHLARHFRRVLGSTPAAFAAH
jgi:AraC-like DNA-binding protein